MFKIFFIFIWKQACVAFSLNKRKFHYLCRFYRLFRLNKFEFLLSKNVVPSLIEICPVILKRMMKTVKRDRQIKRQSYTLHKEPIKTISWAFISGELKSPNGIAEMPITMTKIGRKLIRTKWRKNRHINTPLYAVYHIKIVYRNKIELELIQGNLK